MSPPDVAIRGRNGQRVSGPLALERGGFDHQTRITPIAGRPGPGRSTPWQHHLTSATSRGCSSTASSSNSVGQDLRQHQSGDRGGDRRGHRRHRGGHAPRHRRGAPCVRRDRLVDRPRLQKALPRAASGGARGRAGGTARGADPRGRVSAHGDPRTPARRAAGRRAHPSGQADRRVSLGGRPRRGGVRPHRPADRKAHLARTGRRGRRHRAVELSVRSVDPQARPGAGHRQHRRAQARTRHPLQRHPHRTPGGRTHRHTRRRGQRRPLLGPPDRRGAHRVAQGRPDLVHRIDGGRQADHGEGRGDHEAPVPRARAASRPPSCSTTPTWRSRA